MCFTMMMRAPGLGLVAADTRWGYPDGDHNWGGKVRRIPGGWTVATGSTPIAVLGFRALEQVGVTEMEIAAAVVAEEVARVIQFGAPRGIDMESVELSRFFVARDADNPATIHQINFDGSHDEHQPDGNAGYRYSWPGLEPIQSEVSPLLAERMKESTSVEKILRTIAWLLLYANENGRSMSKELEVGFTLFSDSGHPTACHLRAPAEWIIEAPGDELMASLNFPPKMDPFPSHPAELRMKDLAPKGDYELLCG